jgi:hypothetical protein
LKALVSNRCYPNTFPQAGKEPEWPAIRYAIVSRAPVADACGTDDGSTDEVRVQIDFVARTYGAALALRDAGVAALSATDPPCLRDGEIENYDEQTRTHGVTVDFIFSPSSEEQTP